MNNVFQIKFLRIVLVFLSVICYLIISNTSVINAGNADGTCEYWFPGDQRPWKCGSEYNNVCGNERFCYGVMCGTNQAKFNCTESGCNTECESGGSGPSGGGTPTLEPVFLRTFYKASNGSYKYLGADQIGYKDPRTESGSINYRPKYQVWTQEITIPEFLDTSAGVPGIERQSNPNPTYFFEFYERTRLAYNIDVKDSYYIFNKIDFLKRNDNPPIITSGIANYTYQRGNLPYVCATSQSTCSDGGSGADCPDVGFCDGTSSIDDLSSAKFEHEDDSDAFDGGGAVVIMEVKKSVIGRVVGIDRSKTPPQVVGLSNVEVNVNLEPSNVNIKTRTDSNGYYRLNDPRVSGSPYYTVSVSGATPVGYVGAAKAIDWREPLADNGTAINWSFNQYEADQGRSGKDTLVGESKYYRQSTIFNHDCSSLQPIGARGEELGRCWFAFEVTPAPVPVAPSASVSLISNAILPDTNLYGQYDLAICPTDKSAQFKLGASVPNTAGNSLKNIDIYYRAMNLSTNWIKAWGKNIPVGTNSYSVDTAKNEVIFASALPGNGYYAILNAYSTSGVACSSNPLNNFTSGIPYLYCGINKYNPNPLLTDTSLTKPWRKLYVVKMPVLPANFVATKNLNSSVKLTWNAQPDIADIISYKIYRNSTLIATLPKNATSYIDNLPAINCNGSNINYSIEVENGYNYKSTSATTSTYNSCGNVIKSAPIVGICLPNTKPVCNIECKNTVTNIYGACPTQFIVGTNVLLRGKCVDNDLSDSVALTNWSNTGGILNPRGSTVPVNADGYMYTTYTTSSVVGSSFAVTLKGWDKQNLEGLDTQVFNTIQAPPVPHHITCTDMKFGVGIGSTPNRPLIDYTLFDVSTIISLLGECKVYDVANILIPVASQNISYSWSNDASVGSFTNAIINPTFYLVPNAPNGYGKTINLKLVASYTGIPNVSINRNIRTPSYQNSWIQLFDGGAYYNGSIATGQKEIPDNQFFIGNAGDTEKSKVVLSGTNTVYDHFEVAASSRYNSGGLVQATSYSSDLFSSNQFGQAGKNYSYIGDLLTKKHADLDTSFYMGGFNSMLDGVTATSGYPAVSKRTGSGDLVLSGSLTPTGSSKVVYVLVSKPIVVSGDLSVNASGKVVVFISTGDIKIRPTAQKIDSVYFMTSKKIIFESDSENDTPLLFNGGIYANEIIVQRNLDDDNVNYLQIAAVRGLFDPNVVTSSVGNIPAQIGVSNVYWVIKD